MRMQTYQSVISVYIVGNMIHSVLSNPVPFQKEPRQVSINRKPDGTIVASFAAANAINAPGFDNSFAMSETFEIGPKGMSSSGSNSFSSNVLGNKMSFANAQAQSDQIGGGFSAANAVANSFGNNLFNGGNSQANAFGGGNMGNPFF